MALSGAVAATGAEDLDAFVTSALLWFIRLGEKSRAGRPRRLLLVAPGKFTGATAARLALLREELRRTIALYEIDEETNSLKPAPIPELSDLTATPVAPLFRPATTASELSARIEALAPEAIDAVRARHGETLRFHGLAFARVRRVMGTERLWFGVGATAQRRRLDETNWPELLKLLTDLAAHRRAGADNRAHAMYTAAPEAWLESILRRDITRLDPGLILSPLHAQFRISRGAIGGASRPVDLLALRRDGRLVVIELKVAEDASLPLQCADYWRRVETHRRRGNIARAHLFGDAALSDEPPLVYAVAPLLRFHRAFRTLSRAVTPEIELYRFDINEDWRAGVRVARRSDLT